MLMRTDPFRELDRLTQQVMGTSGTSTRPSVMAMDAWREDDTVRVEFDLPGIDLDCVDLDVERIDASYDAGVLALCIPVAEQAKPRKIPVTSHGEHQQALSA